MIMLDHDDIYLDLQRYENQKRIRKSAQHRVKKNINYRRRKSEEYNT